MKTITSLLLAIALLFGAGCGDEITTYRFSKQNQTTAQQAPYQAEVKATPVKTCSPPCTGSTTCNSGTGKCEGTATSNTKTMPVKGHSPNTFHYDYVVLKNGREGPNDF